MRPARQGLMTSCRLFTSGVTDPHAAALAMPVFGIGDALVGALTISGPVSRLTAARAEEVKEMLVEAAHKLTAACGGAPPGRGQAREEGQGALCRMKRNAVLLEIATPF